MAPEDESNPGIEQPTASASPATPQRDRPRRGHRGRGHSRRRTQKSPPNQPARAENAEPPAPFPQAEQPDLAPEPVPEFAPEKEEAPAEVATPPRREPREPREPLPPVAYPPAQPRQPASPATVQKAIDEVNDIIRTLRESLDDMEEVLEMLEVFERQASADEREIESLRRGLRQMQRPRERDGGQQRGRG